MVHETNMSIPIFNSIYENEGYITSKEVNFKTLNNLDLSIPDKQKFPCLKIIDKISNEISLLETVLISANDELVRNFLNKKINFSNIYIILNKVLNLKEYKKLIRFKPKSVVEILKLDKQVRLKTAELCIKYKR